MRLPSRFYASSLWLLTDLYQLTMADTYRRAGIAEHTACFHLVFRRNPFDGGFTLACGLEAVADFLEQVRPSADDLEYLASIRTGAGTPLFDDAFLDWLANLPFRLDVDAVPEGTVVFPHEPMLRVVGPLAEAQLVESALVNLVHFPSLIATKAARVRFAARGAPVVEFGMRRAQGVDGAVTASRAAWIGGCESTSHLLAGRLFGIPVRGTHAHSSVMAFDTERDAFMAVASASRDGLTFLVDTYDTLRGARMAADLAATMAVAGKRFRGVRIDSGDLAYLSIEVRRILDDAGFPAARILASGDLDEHVIASLHEQGARIDAWGVGTRLMTGHPDAAVGAVYKLAAVRRPGERWRRKLKRSDQAEKSTVPGVLRVRRFEDEAGFVADAVYDELLPEPGPRDWEVVHPGDPTRRKRVPPGSRATELLVPVFRGGKRVWEAPALDAVRRRARNQQDRLHPGVRRLLNPHDYPAGLERSLHEVRQRALIAAREGRPMEVEAIGEDAVP